MEFSMQEYWSGLIFLTPANLSDLGIEPMSHFLHWQVGSLPLVPPGNLEANYITSLLSLFSFLWNEDTNPRGTGTPYRVISCLHIFSSLFKGKWQGCPIELKLTIWLAFISEMCAEVVSALTGKNLQKPQSPCFCHNNSHWWCLCHSRIGKTWCPPPPILDGCLILVEAFVVESH